MTDVIKVYVAAAAHVVEVHADWTCSDERHAGVHVAWMASQGAHCPLCLRLDAIAEAAEAAADLEESEREANRLRDDVEELQTEVDKRIPNGGEVDRG